MKLVGMLLAVVGAVILVYEIVMAVTKYHMTRSHDAHQFWVGLAIGLVLAVVGGVIVRQAGE